MRTRTWFLAFVIAGCISHEIPIGEQNAPSTCSISPCIDEAGTPRDSGQSVREAGTTCSGPTTFDIADLATAQAICRLPDCKICPQQLTSTNEAVGYQAIQDSSACSCPPPLSGYRCGGPLTADIPDLATAEVICPTSRRDTACEICVLTCTSQPDGGCAPASYGVYLIEGGCLCDTPHAPPDTGPFDAGSNDR